MFSLNPHLTRHLLIIWFPRGSAKKGMHKVLPGSGMFVGSQCKLSNFRFCTTISCGFWLCSESLCLINLYTLVRSPKRCEEAGEEGRGKSMWGGSWMGLREVTPRGFSVRPPLPLGSQFPWHPGCCLVNQLFSKI